MKPEKLLIIAIALCFDTNVISEIRKGGNANPGVRQFFDSAITQNTRLYISAITIGALRRGVDGSALGVLSRLSPEIKKTLRCYPSA